MPPLAGERWYVVPKGETAQAVRRQMIDLKFEVRDLRRQTVRHQTSDGPFGPAVSAFYDVRAPSFGRGFPSLFFKQHQV